MSARTVAPANVHWKHPASRTRVEKIQRWIHADPTLAFMRLHQVTLGGWAKFWMARAIRFCWFHRDITPGPGIAAVYWLWSRSPLTFGPQPPALPLWLLTAVAGGVGYWSLRHRDKASQDRADRRDDRVYANACLDVGLYPIPDTLWKSRKPHVTRRCVAPIAGSIDRKVWLSVTGGMGAVYQKRVKYTSNDDGTGIIAIHHHDPLKDEPTLPAHLGNDDGPVIQPTWRRMPLGTTSDDDTFTFSPHEQHVLIGGQTGSGKTSSADALLISFMAAQHAEAVAIAPERASFMFARGLIPCAENPEAAMEQMREEHQLLEKRDALMDELDTSLLFPSARCPLHGIFIDELQNLLDPTIQGDAYVKEFKSHLADILDRGRKRGIVVVAICTNPRKTVLTEGIRDQFTYRLCFRVADADAAGVVLGPVAKGFEPHLLPKVPGRCVLKSDDYYQLRTFRIWDQQAKQAAISACDNSQPFSQPVAGTAVDWPVPLNDVVSSDVSADLPTRRRRPSRHETRGVILAYCQSHPQFTAAQVSEDLDMSLRTVTSWFNDKERTNPIRVVKLGGGVMELAR